MKNCIKVIIFDDGGVLTNNENNYSLYEFIKKTFDVNSQELAAVLYDFNISLHNKTKTERGYWQDYAVKKNMDLPYDFFECLDKEKMMILKANLNTEMRGFVKDLKKQGYTVVVFSNIIKEIADIMRINGYYDIFDVVVLSCDIGVMKPHPQAYDKLIAMVQEDVSSCIFIDDKEENIIAGRDKGIEGIVFKSKDLLQYELNKYL
jgi:HAD superfamily hydrolase (TIGR01509 family)